MNKNIIVVALVALAAGCSSPPRDAVEAPPLDPTRKVSKQECGEAIQPDGANLLCHQLTEAELRARAEEEARLAREKKEAAERAERERLERERAEQLAREEAARKAREAEEARLAAERRRAEEEAARRAQEERERREREEAEARARAKAEQEAREAAARECRRIEELASAGRAMLANFVSIYGGLDEFKEITAQITAFLDKPRAAKPCPSS